MLDPRIHGLTVGNHRMACTECDKGKSDTALSVDVRADGSAVWWCFRCHAHGGIRGDRVLTAHRGDRAPAAPAGPDPREEAKKQASAIAACRAIWKQVQPLAGTLGEDYLRLRHCALPPADGDLRFHAALFCPEIGHDLPALVAKVTTVTANKAIGLHRIWFRPGEPKAIKKMRLGASDAPVCIRLWPDDAVTLGLGIAEGVETALAAAQAFKPMWSTIDAGQMAKFPLVAGIESLTVFTDYDKAGLDAAKAVGQRYMKAGRNANVLRPQFVGEDFNDVISKAINENAHG
jgi:hypothetical protein